MDALNKMADQLKHAEGNKSQEFVCVKTSKKLTKFAEEKNKQHIQSDETVTFTAEQSIKSFLQQIKIFGKATITQLATQKMQTGVVSKQTEVNVKVRDDIKKCDVCGSCITEDGTLLLLDYRNQKLKRMDITAQTVKDYLALISQGNAVCMVSETEAAVSLNNMTVQLVLLGETMSASRTLTFNHHCWGLAYNNGKLFISNFGDSVYIHDMNCKELRKITKDGSGKCIFEFTRHIAISVGKDRLFVADSNNGLITLDMHGNYLYTLNNRDIGVSNLWGVCTDARYVYLCGRGPNNITQLTPDAKFIEPIGTVKSSYSIAIDSGKSIIFVTKPDNDTITVLQFA